MNFSEVRQNLLEEAKASPNLLSDIAGLENYISESYHNRSFIELLQNADDANATKFKIIKSDEFLFVANNGRTFSQQDLESLCRSASSKKMKGETIGYRGIGFKSVVGFSKEKTKLEIPEATNVPLIRIPHLIDSSVKGVIAPILQTLKAEGFTTIFVFTGVTANSIESEFNSIEYNALIFLRNILETEITLSGVVITKITKKHISDSELEITFKTNDSTTNWLISNSNGSSIAFLINEDKITKLPPEKSLIHTFLPTEEFNGLGVLLNSNFSTDPSRRHLIFDSDTITAIKHCSKHIVSLLKDKIKKHSNESVALVNALIPYSDPRMIQFTKDSFLKRIVEEMKQVDLDFFKKLKLCPTWLNPKDFQLLAPSTNTVNNSFCELEGFTSFAKYLGASEAQFDELTSNINRRDLSILGCAQLTKYLFQSIVSNKNLNELDILELKIIYSNGERKSISELKKCSCPIDESFISLLLENGLTEFDIKQMLKKYLPNNQSEILSKSDTFSSQSSERFQEFTHSKDSNFVMNWFNKSKEESNNLTQMSIKRWRSAEESTLEILNLNGFKLKDVSKQNIGYDLEGYDPHGNEIQIEIKSITFPGQKFKFTNNEIAVAQVKQKSFFVAVVRQVENTFEIALISDPINNLVLNRQCVQWIWECESYEYKPMKFEI